jgi:hypothetical protein
VWKVYFELAQKEERLYLCVSEGEAKQVTLQRCKEAYVQAVLLCPTNLRWKCWLASARTELISGRLPQARLLLNRALDEVPEKSLAQVLLECSRLEEFVGNKDLSRSLLACARNEAKQEWKVFLESVLVEMRVDDIPAAIEQAYQALALHTGTGRLWAVLIQLMYIHPSNKEGENEALKGHKSQMEVFQEALREVPKSGEVWCEGARIYMNPLLSHLSLASAHKFLGFAIQFTPQYGDSFIELLRFVMLMSLKNLWTDKSNPETVHLLKSRHDLKKYFVELDISSVERKCVNADPNYGAMWFHCKSHPSDGALLILNIAKQTLAEEISSFSHIYTRAFEAAENKFAPDLTSTIEEVKAMGADFCMVSFF